MPSFLAPGAFGESIRFYGMMASSCVCVGIPGEKRAAGLSKPADPSSAELAKPAAAKRAHRSVAERAAALAAEQAFVIWLL